MRRHPQVCRCRGCGPGERLNHRPWRAGINDEDLATVRERTRIEDVVGSYVTLRNAGGGSLVGLCPFHDEKTPWFQVTPARGFFYCFGCGEGGDVISFLQEIDNSFVEAVEFLADRVGVQLRYTDGGGARVEPGLRSRVLEANRRRRSSSPTSWTVRMRSSAGSSWPHAASTVRPPSNSASASPRRAAGSW